MNRKDRKDFTPRTQFFLCELCEKTLRLCVKKKMRKGLLSLLIVSFSLLSVYADGSLYAPQSALSEGTWVKISVEETGIYKLTYADIRKMGFSDPAKVSVHGYGGWMLDENFSKPYTDDVPATAVWRGNDYLLFYAKGPVKWQYDDNTSRFVHENNPYSNHGYYFITDASPVKDMASVASVDNGA